MRMISLRFKRVASAIPLHRVALVVLVLSAVALAGLATAACTIETETDEGPAAALSSPQAATTTAPTRPAARIKMVYIVPAVDPIADGNVFVRTVDAKTGTLSGPDQPLGTSTTAPAVPSSSVNASTPDYVLLQGVSAPPRVVSLSDEISTVPTSAPPSLPVALAPDGALYYQASTGGVTGAGSGGQQVASFAVPTALPGEPTLDGKPLKGQISIETDSAGYASQLVIGDDGHVYVFVENSVNSALVDLTSNRRLDLPGYGYVAGAVLAPDGYAYAILWDPSRTGNAHVLAQFDLQNLKLVRSVDTGIGPWAISVVATQAGEVFAYACQQPASDELAQTQPRLQRSTLLRLEKASFALTPISLPDNIGLDVSLGVDGKLYLFAGLARERVSSYDPATGTLSRDIPGLESPAGSYIQAVFVR